MDMATKAKGKLRIGTAPKRRYPDLHDHLKTLAKEGLLVTVDRVIDKDTEMHPLVRWQFRGGIPEKDRKAFLFTHVSDAKGKRFSIPVAVGVLATNRQIYSIGMACDLDKIDETWNRAVAHPIPPRVVETAPCQEIVITGKALDKPGQGLDGLPIPISTPGWDISPYTTLSQYITKDPETGIQNMGIYRGQVKAPRRLGMNPSLELRPGIMTHWEKAKAKGKKLPAAVILGCPPCIAYTSAQKLPETMDEFTVAGALVGSPINVVKAKTVDLLVPAEAEIVIEGLIDTEYLEPEAPFGESHGHVNLQEYNAFMEITAITRRRDAILTSIISQVTPSESSLIKRVALEPMMLTHLTTTLGIKGIKKVSMHEPLTNLRKVLVLWAMSYRANPLLDMHVLPHRDQGHGPRSKRNGGEDGSVLMDATLKEDFPPVSLPKRPFMERAKQIWEELGLPALKPEQPWFGYSLGEWPDELDEAAERAVKGDYFETGKEIAKRRRKDVAMNTEVRDLADEKPRRKKSSKP